MGLFACNKNGRDFSGNVFVGILIFSVYSADAGARVIVGSCVCTASCVLCTWLLSEVYLQQYPMYSFCIV